MKQIRLGSREIGFDTRAYVIAEIGVNHGGSLDLARTLVDLAREGGADAVKFQSYKAELLATQNSPAYWDTTKETTTSQFQLFKKFDRFTPDDYAILAEHCNAVGIDFVSTPFDEQAVTFLDCLVPFFKIASADINNVPLLRAVGARSKPVVLSTGASTLAEVEIAVKCLTNAGCPSIALMHCVLNYPTARVDANLGMIGDLRRHFPDHVMGYSDHVVPDAGMAALTTAYLLGARVIEKHFTHDKTLPGNDHYHAMDVQDLKQLTRLLEDIRVLVGDAARKRPLESEAPARQNARRSIVAARRLEPGQVLTAVDLIAKRPGTGLSVEHWDAVIGRRLVRAIDADTLLSWQDLEDARIEPDA